MLLPGTRRNLFTAAYDELKDILLLEDTKKPNQFATAYEQLKGILLEDNKRNGYRRVADAFKEMKDILMDNKRSPLSWNQWKAAPVKEEFFMEILISTMLKLNKPKQAVSEEELKEGRIHIEETKRGYNNKGNFTGDAWILAQRLLDMGEEMMWEEIQRVWVEMLCFSASRCRGYLHAKALGKLDGKMLLFANDKY
ncbi:hypothetical protein BDA96_08G007700 [Sorghum bicolor]|jgi:hypothetical protein|uniref:Uncharacterized protein n=1 Tax=Sorghum bicolor TaxID=4558 RepID=A0A921QD98_SORBI|nr:hypothetical protein BDA96_08G007700 [Sorghum bicolor]